MGTPDTWESQRPTCKRSSSVGFLFKALIKYADKNNWTYLDTTSLFTEMPWVLVSGTSTSIWITFTAILTTLIPKDNTGSTYRSLYWHNTIMYQGYGDHLILSTTGNYWRRGAAVTYSSIFPSTEPMVFKQ